MNNRKNPIKLYYLQKTLKHMKRNIRESLGSVTRTKSRESELDGIHGIDWVTDPNMDTINMKQRKQVYFTSSKNLEIKTPTVENRNSNTNELEEEEEVIGEEDGIGEEDDDKLENMMTGFIELGNVKENGHETNENGKNDLGSQPEPQQRHGRESLSHPTYNNLSVHHIEHREP